VPRPLADRDGRKPTSPMRLDTRAGRFRGIAERHLVDSEPEEKVNGRRARRRHPAMPAAKFPVAENCPTP
jgi:hypothetical protein